MEFLILLGSLILTMLANVVLGINLATITETFDLEVLKKGIYKAGLNLVGVALLYGATYLTPNIMVANINGFDVNLIDAMELLFIAGIMSYGMQALVKIKDILKVNTDIKETTGEIAPEEEEKEAVFE